MLDRDHQVVFFCLIGRAFTKHPDGLIGTFRDQDGVARFDVDGLPRLVQNQAEGFLHNVLFQNVGGRRGIGRLNGSDGSCGTRKCRATTAFGVSHFFEKAFVSRVSRRIIMRTECARVGCSPIVRLLWHRRAGLKIPLS